MLSDINQDGNHDANFPSTLQANNNGNTPSATSDDDVDDDATVQTSNSNSTKQAWMSFNIKLLLTSKQDTSDSALQHAMLTILETIDREVGTDVKIFDGNKQQVAHFDPGSQSVTVKLTRNTIALPQLGFCLHCRHV
jgi:hypothetical protein